MYGYHFRLLTELRHQIDLPVENKLSIPYFLLQSLIECATKLKEGIPDQVAHHGLIKLLVEDALYSYKVPLSWEAFKNLTRDGDIRMLTEDSGSSSSEEKETVAAGKKETGQKTPTTVQKKEQRRKHEKKDAEEKGDTPILSVREKRLQRRTDKAEKVHISTSTSSAPATKPKSKTHAEKQAKVVTPVSRRTQKQASTGSPKIIEKGSSTGRPRITKTGSSTGSPKLAKTWSSTGSPEKVKPKEKKADIRERETAAVLASLSTPPKPKEKRKRETPLYFEARRSVKIKTGKPQPPSSSPIIIEDAPTSPKETSPSRITVTYEKGSPKKTKWQERLDLLTEKARLQEAENVLQDTLARLQETEKREEEGPSSPPREGEVEPPKEAEKQHIPEPSPQPSLSSYNTFLEAGKIIPQKFTVPLFFALEEERVRTHTWMQIAKSKGVVDIGPLQEQLKEVRSELAMAKHVANCQRVYLQEENQKLRLQLQELRAGAGTSSKGTTEEQQGKKELTTGLEEPMTLLQEAEQQAQIEVQALKEQLQQKEAQLACMASWAMEAI